MFLSNTNDYTINSRYYLVEQKLKKKERKIFQIKNQEDKMINDTQILIQNFPAGTLEGDP